MSINSAMQAGVAGLIANSSALAAISDNIANVNTVGYKRSSANFSSMVTSQGKSGGYSAGGVGAKTHQFISQQGLAQATSSSLDLSISGAGFFVTTEKPEGLSPTDTRSFTRAGAFTLDNLGYLKNDAGLYLQGWLADPVTGRITTDPSDLSRLSSINVATVGGAAEKTTRAGVNANLRSEQAVSAAVSSVPMVYDPVANAMSDYALDPTTGVKPDFEIQIPVSDSKGGQRTITLSLLKGSGPNEWYAELRAKPGDLDNNANGLISSGKITFTNDGKLASTGTLFGTTNPTALSIGASDPLATGSAPRWADGLGIDSQSVQVDLASAAGGLTQFNSQSVVQSVNTNGTAFGNLTNIEIDDEGYVSAIFDNGVTRRIAQAAIATFANPDGLKAISGNAYRVTNESGGFSLKVPGQGGSGLIAPSTLEASTVDLSVEFTGLITTQRAYSACSKIITTADEMLQELLNMKR